MKRTSERKTSTTGLLVRLAVIVVLGVLFIGGVFIVYPILFSLADGVTAAPSSSQKPSERIIPPVPIPPPVFH